MAAEAPAAAAEGEATAATEAEATPAVFDTAAMLAAMSGGSEVEVPTSAAPTTVTAPTPMPSVAVPLSADDGDVPPLSADEGEISPRERQLAMLMELGFHAQLAVAYCDGRTPVEQLVDRILADEAREDAAPVTPQRGVEEADAETAPSCGSSSRPGFLRRMSSRLRS